MQCNISNKKKAICILIVNPNVDTFIFAETLKNEEYDIFICIDNNKVALPEYDTSKINIIAIDNDESKDNYFFGTVAYALDRACSRDKALYYFCKKDKTYDYVWFLEEDVFVPTLKTIPNIDESNKHADLLTNFNEVYFSHNNPNNSSIWWQNWWLNEGKIDFPWAHSMICAVRVSKKLLECILDFATKNRHLLFDELLFNTIALHNNLIIANPPELSNIVFSFPDIIPDEVNPDYLYHPIKNLCKQKELRENLLNKVF